MAANAASERVPGRGAKVRWVGVGTAGAWAHAAPGAWGGVPPQGVADVLSWCDSGANRLIVGLRAHPILAPSDMT